MFVKKDTNYIFTGCSETNKKYDKQNVKNKFLFYSLYILMLKFNKGTEKICETNFINISLLCFMAWYFNTLEKDII